MSGSIYGKHFQISTWGESHGKALGVVIDGCPAGISLCESDIQKDLDRRKPGSSPYTTKRQEQDSVEILSGVFQGKTTGTPISLIVYNQDQRSKDYSQIAEYYRPGHADYTFDQKYGFRDYRGGGRSSGRETLSRVAAGAIAKKILAELKISFLTYTYSIGNIVVNPDHFDSSMLFQNALVMPDKEAAQKAAAFLEECISKGDSAGGVIECQIKGIPAGIGEPVFDKLDAALAKGICSIGAVKGIEFGSGFQAATSYGSVNNDSFFFDENGVLQKQSNCAGGVSGGISDASPLIFRAAFKPTPSIYKTQKTVSVSGENIEINIKGRHDPIIVPRAVIVVEAMAAITLVDLLFQSMFSRMDYIKRFFEK